MLDCRVRVAHRDLTVAVRFAFAGVPEKSGVAGVERSESPECDKLGVRCKANP